MEHLVEAMPQDASHRGLTLAHQCCIVRSVTGGQYIEEKHDVLLLSTKRRYLLGFWTQNRNDVMVDVHLGSFVIMTAIAESLLRLRRLFVKGRSSRPSNRPGSVG